MADSTIPFVINDRRKRRGEDTLDTPQTEAAEAPERTVPATVDASTVNAAAVDAAPERDEERDDEAQQPLPPPPTAEEITQVQQAYDATSERLDTMVRATNPGADHLPPMDFPRLVQSLYMTAMVQLGAGTPQGEQARVDLLGAKQSIDMLGVVADKTTGNLEDSETRLMESALFELRMAFLEITQMLARQSAAAGGPQPGAPRPPAPGPRIVR